MADRRQERVEIGYVARAHGIRGELRVVTHDPESTALDDLDSIFVGGHVFALSSARPTRGAWLVKLAEVGDRNRAEGLKGLAVEVLRDDLELDEGEVLLAELVGCRAVLESGEPWGEIVAVETGAQDRLVIHRGDVEVLLPVVDALVLDVDLEGGEVTVAPPEGLPETPIGRQH